MDAVVDTVVAVDAVVDHCDVAMELGMVTSAGPLGFQMWWYGGGSGLNGFGLWVAGQGPWAAAVGETIVVGMPPLPKRPKGDSVRSGRIRDVLGMPPMPIRLKGSVRIQDAAGTGGLEEFRVVGDSIKYERMGGDNNSES